LQGIAPRRGVDAFKVRANPLWITLGLATCTLIVLAATNRQWLVSPVVLGILGGIIQSLRRDKHQMPPSTLPFIVGYVATAAPNSLIGVLFIPLVAAAIDLGCSLSIRGALTRGVVTLAPTVVLAGITYGLAVWMVSSTYSNLMDSLPALAVMLLGWVWVLVGSVALLRKIGFAKTEVRVPSLLAGFTFSVFGLLTTWMFVIVEHSGQFGLAIFLGVPMLAQVMMRNATMLHQENMNKVLYGFSRLLHHAHPYTGAHSRRVSDLAEKVGLNLGIYDKRLDHLKHAALLHDIGKLAVDEEILEKPGRLTEEEFESVKMHAEHGARILRLVWDFGPVSTMVRYHHERLDGRGYPKGISGSQIPIESRVISAIDAFDAMTGDDEEHRRAYRRCVTPEEGMAELKRCMGSQFDPEVVAAFEQALQERSML
jgi:hypothetical protein